MSENETKSKSAVWLMVGTIVCLIIMGFFLLTYEQSNPLQSTGVNQMQAMTQEVQGMEADVKHKENEVSRLADQYQQKTGSVAPVDLKTLDLGPEEKKLLQQAIGNEKDVSTRSLLQEILNKTDEINTLKTKIAAIESQLPTPHIAQKGETHYQVALAFLVHEKGLSKAQAQDILARTALFEELAAGFKVWNFYTGNEFGTSVTQGDALVSPNTFMNRNKKKLITDFGEALAQRNELSQHYGEVVSERDTLVQSYKANEEKQKELTEENENLAARVGELNKQVNSMYYRLDSHKNLEKKGVLKSRFLRATKLNDIPATEYDQALDLTNEDELVISAAAIGLNKIKGVVLYPKTYKKGSSYTVSITPNQKLAMLTLTDRDKFKSERVVIAVN